MPRIDGSPIPEEASKGRPLVREPFAKPSRSNTAPAGAVGGDAPSASNYAIPYYERGQRWTERQETLSLRAALDDMDREKQGRLHAAAQEEASRLVREHQSAAASVHHPATRDYKQHLRKGSHAKSQGVGPYESLYVTKGGAAGSVRSSSSGSRRTASSESKSSSGTSSSGRVDKGPSATSAR